MPLLRPRGHDISIHALREEGDLTYFLQPSRSRSFLSTPSARRATQNGSRGRFHGQNFYPRPPRGGRQVSSTSRSMTCLFLSTPSARRATIATAHRQARYAISIHALREEGDGRPVRAARHGERFLSTPSARRATGRQMAGVYIQVISIHALREEGDDAGSIDIEVTAVISIHALREEGDFLLQLCHNIRGKFLSTPSARRATWPSTVVRLFAIGISIHALREEGDAHRSRRCSWQWRISIHALREEGDYCPP